VGADTYTFTNNGGATQQSNNRDVIHCAIIYKPAAVVPLGLALMALVTGMFERLPLAQLFVTRHHIRFNTLALVVNRSKFKASVKDANANQNDSQGVSKDCCRLEAYALAQLINKTVMLDRAIRVICIGNYNANY
jgi:predicted extracellular nuclease